MRIHQALRDWASGLSKERGADLALRAIGSGWFFLLAMMVLTGGLHGTAGASPGWPMIASRAGLLLFYLTLWLLIIIRPRPVARANGVLPNIMAIVGTYLPWLIVAFPRRPLPDAAYLASTGFILCGTALTLLVVWHLGRSFSLVPQARRLVTSGPYAIVRHPLYLAEEVMFAGTAILYLSPLTIGLLAVHIGVQILRMIYEEEVLTRAFPDYEIYARRTWRVMPWIW